MTKDEAKGRITEILRETKIDAIEDCTNYVGWGKLEMRLFDVINGLDAIQERADALRPALADRPELATYATASSGAFGPSRPSPPARLHGTRVRRARRSARPVLTERFPPARGTERPMWQTRR